MRDLDTGAERHFPGPPLPAGLSEEMDDPAINDLALSPDSTRLAFDYFNGEIVYVSDLGSSQSLADARQVDVDGARSPAWRADGTLAVAGLSGSLLTVDPTTLSAIGHQDLEGWGEELDADDSGRLVVRVSLLWPEAGADSTFVVVDTDGQVSRMTKPYHTVVW